MTTEEFQKIVLEELRELRVGQEELRKEQKELRVGQEELRKEQKELRVGQDEIRKEQKELRVGQDEIRKEQKELRVGQERIEKDLKAVIEQTADLTEFRHEVVEGLEEINSVISRLEIATAENWSDIAKLKAVRRMY